MLKLNKAIILFVILSAHYFNQWNDWIMTVTPFISPVLFVILNASEEFESLHFVLYFKRSPFVHLLFETSMLTMYPLGNTVAMAADTKKKTMQNNIYCIVFFKWR